MKKKFELGRQYRRNNVDEKSIWKWTKPGSRSQNRSHSNLLYIKQKLNSLKNVSPCFQKREQHGWPLQSFYLRCL